MSKKPVLIDISTSGRDQNVQETSFNRHFNAGRGQNVQETGLNRHFNVEKRSKCPRNRFK
jgi:hypothetical protein